VALLLIAESRFIGQAKVAVDAVAGGDGDTHAGDVGRAPTALAITANRTLVFSHAAVWLKRLVVKILLLYGSLSSSICWCAAIVFCCSPAVALQA
jgi:hypothetical protein